MSARPACGGAWESSWRIPLAGLVTDEARAGRQSLFYLAFPPGAQSQSSQRADKEG